MIQTLKDALGYLEDHPARTFWFLAGLSAATGLRHAPNYFSGFFLTLAITFALLATITAMENG